MRRVVVTGMGIVSSIGNNVAGGAGEPARGEVRHHRAPKNMPSSAFAARCTARRRVKPEEMLDRRAMRFHGGGTAWNHVAMDQAILDAGLAPDEVSNERTGLIMGSGGPSTRAIVEAADIARTKGPKRVGPFAVPKAMCSTASATLSTWFKIKGVNYSISSACATSNHCIGAAYEQIQMGKQDIMFAGGCEDLDWTLSVLFDAMGAMSSAYNDDAGARLARLRQEPRRLRHFRRRRRAGARRTTSAPRRAARGSTARSSAMARLPTASTWSRRRAKARRAACARRYREREDRRSTTSTRTPPRPRSATSEEIEAMREVFGSGDKCPPISATKSLTGHSQGATGVQEAIYSLLMMQNGFICESAHIDELDPAFADMPIVRERRDNVQIAAVLSNSFGFGGTNATLVFKHVDA